MNVIVDQILHNLASKNRDWTRTAISNRVPQYRTLPRTGIVEQVSKPISIQKQDLNKFYRGF